MTQSPFASIESWVFDLDNTLYPHHSNLFDQIDQKMSEFVQKLTGKPAEQARELQVTYYKEYGTTLRGLMLEHDIEPDEFLEYVHNIDHSVLAPNPKLADAINQLPGKCYIMTNGTRKHAVSVANRLGITHHFEDIFGIMEAGLIPKPAEETYRLFLEKNGIHPQKAAMFEDLSRNLVVPNSLGMRTVLVVPDGTREVFREDWELSNGTEPHVDFVTDHLDGFLHDILGELKS
ncbi:haloacid dehalogenase-like hydrolase [Pseudovibrio axinellae]|uniref:Haloacid dehalogenase-like hydrolase n=1 Tax=Pseudovibrio axinellae TaxID=989403 RepID=A0A165ZR21_9HYPH|nr:pyrimidine 5'-nucleotidase [Pseudovibrio axinellae]KZL20189.1 haloacid dehalogenase-like hydrolase [Pseudovibrio axinellae]SEQ60235.1 putative hydrolase of the HAD superfamily [Pseudovibrio axinellae]